MWNELGSIKSGKKELREFGLTVGAVLVLIGALAVWRGRQSYPYFLTPGFTLIILALAAPAVLKPLQKAWMALAIVLGFFVSRLAVIILFFVVVTPIAAVMKVMRKDLLDERIEKERASYWVKPDVAKKTKGYYENQY